MRKLSLYSCLLFTAAMLTVFGCTTVELHEESGAKVFTASIGAGTKTILDQSGNKANFGKVYWEEGDEVSINGIIYVATPKDGDATKAILTKKNSADQEPESPYTACYPASNYSNADMVPISQQYAPGANLSGVNPMTAHGTSTSLEFHNLGALFELTVKGSGTDKVKTISFCRSELSCGPEGVALSESGTKFYIAVEEGEYGMIDLSIDLTNGKSFRQHVFKQMTIERNTINRLTVTPINKSCLPTGFLCGFKDVKSIVFNVHSDKQTDNIIDYNNNTGLYAMAYYEVTGSVLNIYTPADCYIPEEGTLFTGMSNLESVALGNIDFSGLESVSNMFFNCPNLKGVDFRGTDFSNAKEFYNFFKSCTSLESVDLTGLDTSGAESLAYMFALCQNLKEVNFGGINTSNVKTMDSMFHTCTSLETLDLSGFDTKSVNYMPLMFALCHNLKSIDISTFNITGDMEIQNLFGGVGLESGVCIVKCSAESYPYLYTEARYSNVVFDYGGHSAWYESSDYSNDGKVRPRNYATEGKGVNLILMGEGYSDRMIADGTYGRQIDNAMTSIFWVEPFRSLRDNFNVYEVDVVSKNEFISESTTTALEAKMRKNGLSTVFDCNMDKIRQYALKALPSETALEEAIVVVIVNNNVDGGVTYYYVPSIPTDYGSGLSIAILSECSSFETFRHVIQHECGHAIGKLADEYQYDGTATDEVRSSLASSQDKYGWYRNVSVTSDLTKVPWSRFVGDSRYASEEIGAYEGAYEYAYGIWRPTLNSMMREDNMCSIFNAPSRSLIYYRINKLAYGDEWQYDFDKFVEFDKPNWGISFGPSTRANVAGDPASFTYRGPAPVELKHW